MREVDGDDSDQGDHAPKTIRQTTVGSKVLDILPEDFERFVKDAVRLAVFSSHSEAAAVKRDDIKARKEYSLWVRGHWHQATGCC